jgi:hypothetical protein
VRTGCHDCRVDVARERFERSRAQSDRPYAEPCSLDAHPDVPTRYVLCTEDRLMDNDFWRTAVPERLGVEPVELAASHSPMASRSEDLTHLLVAAQ